MNSTNKLISINALIKDFNLCDSESIQDKLDELTVFDPGRYQTESEQVNYPMVSDESWREFIELIIKNAREIPSIWAKFVIDTEGDLWISEEDLEELIYNDLDSLEVDGTY